MFRHRNKKSWRRALTNGTYRANERIIAIVLAIGQGKPEAVSAAPGHLPHNQFILVKSMKALPLPDRSVPSDLVLLRKPDLYKVLGVRDTTLRGLRKRPDFPKPIMLTRRICAWRAVDIQRWQEEQIAKQQQS